MLVTVRPATGRRSAALVYGANMVSAVDFQPESRFTPGRRRDVFCAVVRGCGWQVA